MRFHRGIILIRRSGLKPRRNVTYAKFFAFHPELTGGCPNMTARTLKKAIYGSAVIAGLTTTWVVAHAVNSPSKQQQLQTLRDVTIAALEDAIQHGQEGIGPLPVNYIEDDSDALQDDAMMRSLWLRLNNGPTTQASVMHLMQETNLQQQREATYAASALRLEQAGGQSP